VLKRDVKLQLTRVGQQPCIRWGPDPPWEGAILGERGAHCKAWGLSAVGCAKKAEPIDLPFGCRLGCAEGSTSSIVFAATWGIRLNHPSAAAMRPHVKLLRSLVYQSHPHITGGNNVQNDEN